MTSRYYSKRSSGGGGGGIGGRVVAAILAVMFLVFICVYWYEYHKGIEKKKVSIPPSQFIKLLGGQVAEKKKKIL